MAEVLVTNTEKLHNRQRNGPSKVQKGVNGPSRHLITVDVENTSGKENAHPTTHRTKPKKRPHNIRPPRMEKLHEKLFLPLNVNMDALQEPNHSLFRSLSAR